LRAGRKESKTSSSEESPKAISKGNFHGSSSRRRDSNSYSPKVRKGNEERKRSEEKGKKKRGGECVRVSRTLRIRGEEGENEEA